MVPPQPLSGGASDELFGGAGPGARSLLAVRGVAFSGLWECCRQLASLPVSPMDGLEEPLGAGGPVGRSQPGHPPAAFGAPVLPGSLHAGLDDVAVAAL